MAERFAIMCAGADNPSPARVAHALTRHGAEVCIIAPPDSYASLTRYKIADLLMPFEDMIPRMPQIARAMAEEFGAHSVLAADGAVFNAWAHLRKRADDARLSETARTMIDRSLPPPNMATLVGDDARFIAAQTDGPCSAPPSLANPSEADVLRFAAEVGYPVMLKRNAYAAGVGVTRCDNAEALKAAMGDGRANPRDPGYAVQKFIFGEVHAAAVSGVSGKAAAAFSFIKHVKMGNSNGLASVLKYKRHDAILADSKRLYEALGLNGFAGFDYIVDASGRAWLMEVNHCIVLKSHFSACFGVDLVACMLALMRGAPIPAPKPPTHEYVAIFPNEWMRDPQSHFLHMGFHDVPWDDPALLQALVQTTIARRNA